jgi:L-lactate dehydrogenase
VKVSIIGGGGRVGSDAAFALQCAGIVSEIHLLDANEKMAEGEALDLLHGASIAGDQRIYAGGYETTRRRRHRLHHRRPAAASPTRAGLDLINRNVSLFKQILDSLKAATCGKDAIIFVVSNPGRRPDPPRHRRAALGPEPR